MTAPTKIKKRVAQASVTAAHSTVSSVKVDALPSLDELRSYIPEECFKVDTPISTVYLLLFALLLASSIWVYPYCESTIGFLLYCSFYGTVMWSVFCIGHDCGHSVFSSSTLVNDVVGHFTHGFRLVPYWPWALSHHHHHIGHNHVENDFSHFWCTPELRSKMNILGRLIAESNLVLLLLTPINFALYLYPGFGDGTHLFPWGDLWKRTSGGMRERLRGVASSVVVFLISGALYQFGLGWAYFGPWFVYNSWLFIVTYMQHHRSDALVYGDESWTFVKGAFQTVDRVMGLGSDYFTLCITSDHLVHHLFFRGIPHYHLRKATLALRSGLSARGMEKAYLSVYYSSPLHYLAHFASTVLSCGITQFILVN